MMQDLLDKQKKQIVEAIKYTMPCLITQQKDVSTRKVEAITTSKWAEITPANNIASFQPNNVVFLLYVLPKSVYVSEHS
jgi:hypothetical protein